MGWLEPYWVSVLAMAGYPPDHPQAASAREFAEQAIEAYTARGWGAIQPFTHRVRLSSRSYALPLPPDAISVTTVNGLAAPPGTTWHLTPLGLEASDENGQPLAWPAGVWTIAGQRGSLSVPQGVLKAAALLVNAYLGLSDAQRSQFSTAARGDLSYSMRFAALPAPEAETYLAPYVRRIAGGLV